MSNKWLIYTPCLIFVVHFMFLFRGLCSSLAMRDMVLMGVCMHQLGTCEEMVGLRKYHCDVSDRTSSDWCLSSNPMSFLVGVTYMLISSSCQPMFVLYRFYVGLYMIGCGSPYHVLVAIAICFILTSMDRCFPMDLLRHLLELHLGIRHNFAKHHKVQLMEGCIASVCEGGKHRHCARCVWINVA